MTQTKRHTIQITLITKRQFTIIIQIKNTVRFFITIPTLYKPIYNALFKDRYKDININFNG